MNSAATAGLWCTLFGRQFVDDGTESIEHRRVPLKNPGKIDPSNISFAVNAAGHCAGQNAHRATRHYIRISKGTALRMQSHWALTVSGGGTRLRHDTTLPAPRATPMRRWAVEPGLSHLCDGAKVLKGQ